MKEQLLRLFFYCLFCLFVVSNYLIFLSINYCHKMCFPPLKAIKSVKSNNLMTKFSINMPPPHILTLACVFILPQLQSSGTVALIAVLQGAAVVAAASTVDMTTCSLCVRQHRWQPLRGMGCKSLHADR